MTKLLVAVCEDDKIEQMLMKNILDKFSSDINSKIKIKYSLFSAGADFLAGYKPNVYDLIFMDINLGDISGVELITEVRKQDKNVAVAFTTSNLQYALDGYRLNVMKYIEKPVSPSAIFDTIETVIKKKNDSSLIHFHIASETYDVEQNKIVYLEQSGHSVLVNLSDSDTLKYNGELDEFNDILTFPPFYRCHKSYLVNVTHIEKIDRELMVYNMDNGLNVHIKRELIAKAAKIYQEEIMRRIRDI